MAGRDPRATGRSKWYRQPEGSAGRGPTHAQRIKVYLVVDFEPLRMGLASTIGKMPDMRLVGEASSLEEMIESQGYHGADVVVIDVQATNKAKLQEHIPKLEIELSRLKVLFLGGPEDIKTVREELLVTWTRLHTVGFLLKDGPVDRLLQAVRLVAIGTFTCEMELVRELLARLVRWASDDADEAKQQLSARETEILVLVADGRSNKEIARELVISDGTVKAHISHIMAKLNMERRANLIKYALLNGLVALQEGKSA